MSYAIEAVVSIFSVEMNIPCSPSEKVTDENSWKKALAAVFFHDWFSGNVEAARSHVTEDFVYICPGNSSVSPIAGTFGQNTFIDILGQMAKIMVNGIKVDILNLIADGEKVCVVVKASGTTLKHNESYVNNACYVLTLRGDKISEATLYMDTLRVDEVFHNA